MQEWYLKNEDWLRSPRMAMQREKGREDWGLGYCDGGSGQEEEPARQSWHPGPTKQWGVQEHAALLEPRKRAFWGGGRPALSASTERWTKTDTVGFWAMEFGLWDLYSYSRWLNALRCSNTLAFKKSFIFDLSIFETDVLKFSLSLQIDQF